MLSAQNMTLTPRKPYLCLALCLLMLSLSSISAWADESYESWLPEQLHLHAFGSLGASYHDAKDLGYRRNIEQKNTVQANQLGFSSDSLVGAQADWFLNDEFATNLQLVSRNNADGNWKPEVITAFIKYKPSETLQFRLGRMPTASNIGAETRYASYAYTQIRPTPAIYGLLSAYDRYDGVDAEYTTPIATGIGKVIVNYGKTVGEYYISGNSSHVKDVSNYGIVANWQKDNLDLRALYLLHHAENQTHNEALAQALATTPYPLAQQRANELRNTESYNNHIFAASINYDMDAWKLQAVISRSYSDSYFATDGNSGSVLLAYHTGKFTPYGMLAYSKIKTEYKATGLPDISPLQALNTAYNDASHTLNTDLKILSLGVRYDFAENYALKFQVDKNYAKSTPIIISSKPQGTDKDLTLFTVALDFLF
jgi:hypothetical protein